jgi:hypothetical protein
LLFEIVTLALGLLVGISLYIAAEERKAESLPSTLPTRHSAKTKLSDPELKKRGRSLIADLRELQTKYDKAGKDAKSFEKSWAALEREFKKKFYNEALVVEGELVARLRPRGTKLDEHDLDIVTAHYVLRSGKAVGANPYAAVATCIERMLDQIP